MLNIRDFIENHIQISDLSDFLAYALLDRVVERVKQGDGGRLPLTKTANANICWMSKVVFVHSNKGC
ncbi:hypothetical protein VTN31DRAFT_5727 [Thermomyces dupontii]|uniref:uncharacterized protein n=1 Tax=Talaromyces thermophilus TaxID=28565 RepID=UPI003744A134